VLIAATVVAAAAIIAVLAVAALRSPRTHHQPVTVAPVAAPDAAGAECAKLLASVPERLGDYRRAPLGQPAQAGAAAWQAVDSDNTVVLRCGLQRPAEFVVGAPIQVVDAVQWFRAGADPLTLASGVSTWFAVDRAVYVSLTLPSGSGPTPIQEISDTLDKTLPTRPIDPAPAN
jgi:hypothetical protein